MSWFEYKAVLKALLLPPTSLLCVALLGIMLARRSNTARFVAALSVSLLLVLSMPVAAYLLIAVLQPGPPFQPGDARDAGAIVVLGGGARRQAVEYGGHTVAALTLERVRYAARIAKLTRLPILVSGGGPAEMPSEADLMREVLENELGVPVKWAETKSRNTHENAVNSARILKASGIRKVLLVNHAFDMRRAVNEFADQGLLIVPAPTNAIGKWEWDDLALLDFVPSIGGLHTSYYALYELAGNAVRSLPSAR